MGSCFQTLCAQLLSLQFGRPQHRCTVGERTFTPGCSPWTCCQSLSLCRLLRYVRVTIVEVTAVYRESGVKGEYFMEGGKTVIREPLAEDQAS
ncbi:hypothetical protein ASD93_11255 [Microbacterium sp. Root180]|nr:hypothetical protein ASD93_11255 [Microbacterium sp. Root180]